MRREVEEALLKNRSTTLPIRDLLAQRATENFVGRTEDARRQASRGFVVPSYEPVERGGAIRQLESSLGNEGFVVLLPDVR